MWWWGGSDFGRIGGSQVGAGPNKVVLGERGRGHDGEGGKWLRVGGEGLKRGRWGMVRDTGSREREYGG